MKEKNNSPIGVFDSGVGGLTVASEIMQQLPDERIIYFGDTARVPYGSKSKETVTRYSRQIVNFLKAKNVKAIVIACNTASAYALDRLAEETKVPIMGVVVPGAISAAKSTRNNQIGIIGTEGTINSKIYSSVIQNISSEIKVLGKACPLFVPLVEEGMIRDSVTTEIAGRYLSDLQKKEIDTLILGCTHYPLIRETIQEVMGPKITLINPAYETARELKRLLTDKKLLSNNKESRGSHEFFVSDTEEKFKVFAKQILNQPAMEIEKIDIETY